MKIVQILNFDFLLSDKKPLTVSMVRSLKFLPKFSIFVNYHWWYCDYLTTNCFACKKL